MSDAVARLNAALEGRYAIERELGEGGMATVYLADDLIPTRQRTNCFVPRRSRHPRESHREADPRPPPAGR